MLNILRQLKKYTFYVLLALAMLVVQAVCDLALPSYTSDIVDIGIQQSGISAPVPEKIREQTLEDAFLFLKDEDVAVVSSYYHLKDGVYELTGTKEDDIELLSDMLAKPLALLSMAPSYNMDPGALRFALTSGAITKEQLLTKIDETLPDMAGVNDSMLRQQAIAFVKSEYTALGIDVNKMQNSYLLTVGAKMIGVTLIMAAMSVLAGLIGSYTGASVGRDLRQKVFSKVLSFSGAEHDSFSTASLITRSTNDIQQIQMTITMMLRFVIYAPILGIGGVIRVIETGTNLSWIIAVAVALVAVLVGTLMLIVLPKFKLMQKLIDKLNLVSREIITGLPVIRAFNNERHERKRFETASQDLKKTQLFVNRVMACMSPTMMLVMNVVSIAIIYFGSYAVDAGSLQVGNLIAFITYAILIIMSFMMLTLVSIILPRAAVSAGRIQEVLNTDPSIKDPAQPMDDKLSNPKGEVTFNNVSFRFPGAEDNVLQSISFTASPGKTTAIIGATGSGKTSLLNLIPRFYDATEGQVLIDGIDVKNLSLHRLRSLIGYVPQKSVLFSGNIESNLKFGGDFITDEDAIDAASTAQALSFIQEKEEGFKAPVAQGGTNFSGGQKQRLSIARAIAKKPKIFLFDDSFSALDYKTDLALRTALATKAKDATVLIVAQRVSTILHADQILVLDDGKLCGIGTHEELLSTCSVYREIVKSQFDEKELGGALA